MRLNANLHSLSHGNTPSLFIRAGLLERNISWHVTCHRSHNPPTFVMKLSSITEAWSVILARKVANKLFSDCVRPHVSSNKCKAELTLTGLTRPLIYCISCVARRPVLSCVARSRGDLCSPLRILRVSVWQSALFIYPTPTKIVWWGKRERS